MTTPKNFEEANEFFLQLYGFPLILREEPTVMSRNKKISKWVGAAHPDFVLLRRTGYPTSKYPKSHGIIANGGHRLISLDTLLSNMKDGRPLYIKLR